MSSKPIVIRLRRNLRLQDNEVLNLAVNEGRPLILVYIFDETQSENFGGAEKWWLY